MRKNVVLYFLLVLAALSSGFAGEGGKRPLHKKKVPSERFMFPVEYRIPERTEPSVAYLGASNDAFSGIVLGQTDYDYGWGSGSPRRISVHSNNQVHMLVGERLSPLNSPENRLSAKYYYYNGLDTLYSGYPIPKYMSASSPGGIDIFRSGIADNSSVVVGRSPNWFGLSEGPGKASFVTQNMPVTSGSASYPQITVDETRGGLLWYIETSMEPSGYSVLKSADYGGTWVVVQENLLAAANALRYDVGSTGVPILVAGNGDLYVVTTLTSKGKSAVGPLGDGAHPDSADATGYFKSTDAGATWTWTRITADGEYIIVRGDTLYVFPENFGQIDASVDNEGVVYVVVNGYMKKVTDWGDTTSITCFGVLCWKSDRGYNAWELVSNYNDLHYPEYETYQYSGNAFGFAYPTISVHRYGYYAGVVWQQPWIDQTGAKTGSNGIVHYRLHYAHNGGDYAEWLGGPLFNGEFGVFPSSGDDFLLYSSLGVASFKTTAHLHDLHIVFMRDTVAGCSIFDEHPPVLIDNVYMVIPIIVENAPHDNAGQGSYVLHMNFPNPFNSEANIYVTLPQMSSVRLSVLDILGREIAVLYDGLLEAGEHRRTWQAKAPSGVYFCRLDATDTNNPMHRFTQVRKMILLK